MFIIHPHTKTLEEVNAVTFTNLEFSERNHLQLWIANTPNVFGEPLLIIQKEFAGFGDTLERLDLLAIDKNYNLVVIENKLDDSGRDVTWQALKYASYCSALSGADIVNMYQQYLSLNRIEGSASEKIREFLDDEDFETKLNKDISLRIILVAAKFRKEVTSTVLWLLNYNLKIQCFKVSPYKLQDRLLLNIEQVIPLKDAEEYMIRIANKAQDEATSRASVEGRYHIRKEFWEQLLPLINSKSDLFKNVNPIKDNWLGAGSGVGSVPYQLLITWRSASVLLYICRGKKEENDFIFQKLLAQKEKIEADFGGILIWDTDPVRKSSKVEFKKDNVNYFEKDQWSEISGVLADALPRFERAIKPHLAKINAELTKSSITSTAEKLEVEIV